MIELPPREALHPRLLSLPECCQVNGCTYEVSTEHLPEGVLFIHTTQSQVNALTLPLWKIKDTDYPIWTEEVEPWIRRLHADQEPV